MRRFEGDRGRVEVIQHRSDLLEGNPLGDPATREVAVYLPSGYEEAGSTRYRVLFSLAGYTGSGLGHLSWKPFTENLPERLDRLIGKGTMDPVIVVLPDCFTSLGGNQYIDSSAIGPWARYLVEELVPMVDERFRTTGSRNGRGVFGKSSGGYGALMHGILHPGTWGAVACHSGDMYFQYGYLPDFPRALDQLRRHGLSVERFLEHFRAKQKHNGSEIHTLMTVAMAATYDPDPETPLGFHLPFDLETGEVDQERWKRWLRHDPVELVEERAEALKSLRLLYIDCGSRDQYNLHHGARILARKLKREDIPHHYEEFDDDHSSVDFRLDVSLPKLVEALEP
ncbi:MAG TPA: enterochelin esterase [Planctomycetes bacterium]|nr:enterochelin esterase [Planctomycetota bacterium]HIN80120.1 enterochelin esterase [Planctomycetota bacterium]